MSTSQKGKFVVLEGTDGSGKSTQSDMIRDYFQERLVVTREPGGTPYAEEIRTLVRNHPLAKNVDGKTMFMLMFGARAEHMNHLVVPSLEAGIPVLTDRFDSSTYAYNVFAQDELGMKDYFWKTREVILGKYVPDLYIYLDLTPEISAQRRSNRKEDANHFDDKDQNKVRKGLFEFFESVPHVIIDATQTREEIFEDILAVLKELGIE